MEDADVVRRVRDGETEAFSVLVEKYHRRLLNFIHALVGNMAVVEDVGQEVFLSVYKSLGKFDEKRGVPFSAWLFIIARNRCITELRSRRKKREIPLNEDFKLCARNVDAEQTLLKNEKLEALKDSLEQLPEHYRNLMLRRLNEDTLEDIANDEGVPLGTVKSRLFRAVQRMKILVSEYFGGKGYEEI